MEIITTEVTTNWKGKTEIELLSLVYSYASNGLRVGKSKQAKAWLKQKHLNAEQTMACFNSGQLHHRKEIEFKEALERIGFMKKSNAGVNCDTVPYTVFGNYSIMFPLRNTKNEIVNFYAIGLKNAKKDFLNHEGLYPAYPHEQTKKLFVVDSVLDAATLMEAKILDNREAVIALYDGIFLEQHIQVIQGLKNLVEVVQIVSH
jgi:DNA primase